MRTLLTLLLMVATILSNAQLRQTIDEELLSDLVLAKQEEVKKRFLSNFIRKNIKMTNAVTYNTMYDIMDILLREKNKTAMTDALVHKVADYSITYASVWYFIENCPECGQGQDELKNKQGVVQKQPSGFISPDDRFKELDTAYGLTKGGAEGSTGIAIDSLTDFRAGLHNWLLDSMYVKLSRRDSLHALGLFRPDEERKWQWNAPTNYPSFWRRFGEERRQAINTRLDTFCDDLNDRLISLETLARNVALSDPEDIAGLDLRVLGKPIADDFSTIRDSLDLRIRTVAEQFLKDTTDAQRQQTAAALAMLEDVLRTVGPELQAGNSGNKQIGALFRLFLKSVELFRNKVGQNSIIARIADIVTKYVILDPEKEDPLARYGFSIDVEAIILGLEDRLIEKGSSPSKHCWVNLRPFMTIGLNYGYFGGPSETFQAEETYGLQQVAWAGEKIGVKCRLADWRYTRGQQLGEWYKYHGNYYMRKVRPRAPDISNLYLSLYASGILYNIADLRTDESFKRPLIGGGVGITFFNGLELNVSVAVPVVVGPSLSGAENTAFANIGFDIPIFEYIRAARAKRGNG